MRAFAFRPFATLFLTASLALSGYGNNLYPSGEAAKPILFRAIGDDRRTLDSAISYVSGDALAVDAIYPSCFCDRFRNKSLTR